jgi:hypothetical protein
MIRFTLIVGDAATYEENGVHHTDFQTIDFIKTFFTYVEAEAVGEDAISRGGHDTYVIAQNYHDGVVTYQPKKETEEN